MAKRNNSKTIETIKRKTKRKSNDKKGSKIKNSGKDLSGFEKKQLADILKMMVRSRTIDNKAMRLLKQGKTFFHIAAEGHEAVQMAVGLHLDPK